MPTLEFQAHAAGAYHGRDDGVNGRIMAPRPPIDLGRQSIKALLEYQQGYAAGYGEGHDIRAALLKVHEQRQNRTHDREIDR